MARQGKEVYHEILTFIPIMADEWGTDNPVVKDLLKVLSELNRPVAYSEAYIVRLWATLTNTRDTMDMFILDATSVLIRHCVDGESELINLCRHLALAESIHSNSTDALDTGLIERLPSINNTTDILRNNPWAIFTIALEDYLKYEKTKKILL